MFNICDLECYNMSVRYYCKVLLYGAKSPTNKRRHLCLEDSTMMKH